MGMSMGRTYDPSSQSSTTVTSRIFNTLMMLTFFAGNGHHTLLRIILASGQIVPFGSAAFGRELYWAVVELFIDCTILAIKLCMPILAAELLGQVGMGVLMKVIPQINVFAINIDLKVIIGLGLLYLLLNPISEFLLGVEVGMLQSLQRLLPMMSGG
jgi:flagellar biosynthetic protein FliR